MLFNGFWQAAKKSWLVANSTQPDPNQSQPDSRWPPVARNGLKKTIFPSFWTLTFDLDLHKISNFSPRPIIMPKMNILGPTVAVGEAVIPGQTDRQTDRQILKQYIVAGHLTWGSVVTVA